MLDVPGWLESHRLPKAVAVVSALKMIARVRLDCSSLRAARAPRHDVIDLERDADAEQQRQRDDVGEIERHIEQHAQLERQKAREQQRHERQQHVAEAAQGDPEQDRDREQRPESGLDEGIDDGVAGFLKGDGRAGRVGRDREHGLCELAQDLVVVRIAFGHHLKTRAVVLVVQSRVSSGGRFCNVTGCARSALRRSSNAIASGLIKALIARWRDVLDPPWRALSAIRKAVWPRRRPDLCSRRRLASGRPRPRSALQYFPRQSGAR